MRRGGGGANRSRVRCGAGRIAQPPSKYAPPPTCVAAGCTLHISMRVFPDPPIRRFLAPQHHPTLLSNKGELIQDIFLSARAPMCARCVCPQPPMTRRHTRAHRERESLSTSPPRSRNTPRRLRSFLSLARRAPPLATRYSVRGVLLRGPPDRELKVGVRRLPERSRSVGSVD